MIRHCFYVAAEIVCAAAFICYMFLFEWLVATLFFLATLGWDLKRRGVV